MNYSDIVLIAQIIISVLIVILILLQERSGGMSGVFGGGGGGEGFYQARRGVEKMIFYGTIVLVILFTGLALLNLVLPVS